MSASTPISPLTIRELLNTVSTDTAPSSVIQNLFVSSLDPNPDNISLRINDARRVYKIVQSEKPQYAIFYKLNDPRNVDKEISEAFYKIYSKCLKGNTYNNLITKIEFYKEEGSKEEELVAEKMEQVLSSYMKTKQITDKSSAIPNEEIKNLFDQKFKNNIVNVAIDSFFGFPDREAAGRQGALHDPINNQTHNWGVNAVWTAALAAQKTPIQVLSLLIPASGIHSGQTQYTQGSSAFALEIAIVINMGYSINFSSSGKVELLPPEQPNLNVTLPSREEQVQIYKWCCEKQIIAKQSLSSNANPSPASMPIPKITFLYTSAPSASIESQASHLASVTNAYNKTSEGGQAALGAGYTPQEQADKEKQSPQWQNQQYVKEGAQLKSHEPTATSSAEKPSSQRGLG